MRGDRKKTDRFAIAHLRRKRRAEDGAPGFFARSGRLADEDIGFTLGLVMDLVMLGVVPDGRGVQVKVQRLRVTNCG